MPLKVFAKYNLIYLLSDIILNFHPGCGPLLPPIPQPPTSTKPAFIHSLWNTYQKDLNLWHVQAYRASGFLPPPPRIHKTLHTHPGVPTNPINFF